MCLLRFYDFSSGGFCVRAEHFPNDLPGGWGFRNSGAIRLLMPICLYPTPMNTSESVVSVCVRVFLVHNILANGGT